jgi:hypothetical protein
VWFLDWYNSVNIFPLYLPPRPHYTSWILKPSVCNFWFVKTWGLPDFENLQNAIGNKACCQIVIFVQIMSFVKHYRTCS